MPSMADKPTKPTAALDEETIGILAQRNAIFDQEDKAAKPWSEVKAQILNKSKGDVPQ